MIAIYRELHIWFLYIITFLVLKQTGFVTKWPLFHTNVKCSSEFCQFYHCTVGLFLPSFLLEYLPAAPLCTMTTKAPTSSTVGFSELVNACILFLAVPPRSNQRVQQQFYNPSLRVFVQLLFPGSILSNTKFFPLTSKTSESRIHAHIKDDYKLFLPSGAFCKKSCALFVLERYTNADKPVGQRHCSNRAGHVKRESSHQLPWPVQDAFEHLSRTQEENPHKKPPVWSVVLWNNSSLRWQKSSSLNKPQDKYAYFNITCSLHNVVH